MELNNNNNNNDNNDKNKNKKNIKNYMINLYNTLHKLYYIKPKMYLPNYITQSKEFTFITNKSKYITSKLIEIDGTNINYVNNKFKNDPNIALMAIKDNVYANIYIGDVKYTNVEIIKHIAKYNPYAVISNICYLNNLTFIKYTLENNGLYLRYFGNGIRDSEKFVIIAVKNNYNAFIYASIRLKNDIYFRYNLEEIVPEIINLEFYKNDLLK